MNESRPTNEWPTNELRDAYERVMSYIWMGRVTRMNKSCPHTTGLKDPKHTIPKRVRITNPNPPHLHEVPVYLGHVTHLNICAGIMSRIWTSHVTRECAYSRAAATCIIPTSCAWCWDLYNGIIHVAATCIMGLYMLLNVVIRSNVAHKCCCCCWSCAWCWDLCNGIIYVAATCTMGVYMLLNVHTQEQQQHV